MCVGCVRVRACVRACVLMGVPHVRGPESPCAGGARAAGLRAERLVVREGGEAGGGCPQRARAGGFSQSVRAWGATRPPAQPALGAMSAGGGLLADGHAALGEQPRQPHARVIEAVDVRIGPLEERRSAGEEEGGEKGGEER
jgi:hypothetical protein